MRTALLTEHLRYTPLTLLDDIINTVNEVVYQAVNNMESALLNVPPSHLGFVAPSARSGSSSSATPVQSTEEVEEALETAARTEIESGIVKLESLLNATVDKDFDKLEIYTLRNLLTVSNLQEDEGLEDWIILEHYKVCIAYSGCMYRRAILINARLNRIFDSRVVVLNPRSEFQARTKMTTKIKNESHRNHYGF